MHGDQFGCYREMMRAQEEATLSSRGVSLSSDGLFSRLS